MSWVDKDNIQLPDLNCYHFTNGTAALFKFFKLSFMKLQMKVDISIQTIFETVLGYDYPIKSLAQICIRTLRKQITQRQFKFGRLLIDQTTTKCTC